MPSLEQEQSERQRLKGLLDKLAELKPDALVQKEKLGPLSFEEGRPWFERTLRLFEELRARALDNLSYSPLKQLADDANAALQKFSEILEFSLDKHPQNPG